MVCSVYPCNTQFIHMAKHLHFTITSFKVACKLRQNSATNIANHPQCHTHRNSGSSKNLGINYTHLQEVSSSNMAPDDDINSGACYDGMLSGHASFRGVCRSCVVFLLHAPTVGRVGTRCKVTVISRRLHSMLMGMRPH